MTAVFHQVPLYVILRHRKPKSACPVMKTVCLYDEKEDVDIAELCGFHYDYKYQIQELPLYMEKWLNKWVYVFSGSFCESCVDKERLRELNEKHDGWTNYGEGE